MKNRFNLLSVEPKAYEAMFALEEYIQNSKLTKIHLQLIKIRASQINGCAYCIDLHTSEALEIGELSKRIFLLNAWKETTLFTEEENVILSMTEEITNITHNGLSDETYSKAIEVFDEKYVAQIIMAIVIINSWNRISISTKKMVTS